MSATTEIKSVIATAGTDDIKNVMDIYHSAIEYQKRKGFNLWNEFEEHEVLADLAAGNIRKICAGNAIACIFKVTYSDLFIWGSEDDGSAVYLHSIAVNPAYKGNSLMECITRWAADHAKQKQKTCLRMDTWGNNTGLIEYYRKFGFTRVGTKKVAGSNNLPSQYSAVDLCLLELRIDKYFDNNLKRHIK